MTAVTLENDQTTPVAASESGFTAELGRRYAHLFEDFYQHPFLSGLRDGTLAPEKVQHYVGQDHQYLSAYVRCYGLGLTLAPDREWMRYFHERTGFLLDDESEAHLALCARLGVTYEDAQVERLAPSAKAYVDHMMEAGRDTLGTLLAALLPCPWTYIWAADRYAHAEPIQDDHPFAGWWRFYADDSCLQMLEEMRAKLDAVAAQAGPEERARMELAFELSVRHEIRFWQMAWSLETW
ncbi:thiaminase II [Paraoerskovia marina]|uniref:Aminopyrimidine aminohydrolase n=1 Tax=Paraoerskovia marina TaxID=545619 RepID=A0A1H1QJ38_9CELL|nr:thiaminase II [Paraoerskovia marina]SDS23488.1 thiaminase (transcriptional activator TenA) [Paraoerskovia marina]